jgi:hypothetical protein
VEFLPGYAPELNPVEYLWSHWKWHKLRNLCASQVPTAIQYGFATRFPSVKTVEWKLKADKNYDAEFKLKGADVAVKFDVSGKWLETETTIPRSAVPESVSAALGNRFPGHKIVEAQTVVRWDDAVPIYEIHVAKMKEVVKAQLTRDGRMLNQSAKSK